VAAQQGNSGLDLRRLRYFLAVAEELSFSRAADRLYMAQQPLSAAIQKLEAELGVQLFDRSSRRVALTPAGEALIPKARAAVAAAEEAYTTVRNVAMGIAGVLRVGVSHAAHPTAMAILGELSARHPEIELQIRQDAAGPLVTDLREHRIDVLVGASVPAAPRLSRQLVRLDEAFLVVHPRSTHATREPVRLEDLSNETFVISRDVVAAGYNEAVLGFCQEAGFTPRTLTSPGLVAPPGVPPEQWVIILNRPAVGIMQLDFEPVFIPFLPPRYFRIELVWRSGDQQELIDSLLSCAGAVAQRERWLPGIVAAH
jgi:DNA-binding transcriptional LysR family regulator